MYTITLKTNAQGHLDITGPIEDQLVMYGLLEIARRTLDAHYAQVPADVPATQHDHEAATHLAQLTLTSN